MRDFLHQTRCNRLQGNIGHEENGFDFGIQLLVHAGHLILIFEIGNSAQPANDDGGTLRLGKMHEQSVKRHNFDMRNVRGLAPNMPHTLVQREQRRL